MLPASVRCSSLVCLVVCRAWNVCFTSVLGWMFVVVVPCSVPCVERMFHLDSRMDARRCGVYCTFPVGSTVLAQWGLLYVSSGIYCSCLVGSTVLAQCGLLFVSTNDDITAPRDKSVLLVYLYQRDDLAGACQAGAGQRWCQVSSVGEAMSDEARGTRAMLLLGKMDNAGFVSDGRAVEMEPVVSNGTPAGCSDQCLAMHRKSQNTPKKPTESPWHHWKTIFLVVTMVALTVWIIVYTVLSQMGLL
uniref:Uncharacterized protein n=1 Tax=Timema douglasi TaxID=61478 RepID=A0A7R8VNN8_TIMDO|nr:unnamed protein product [Timema douglasi]